MKMVQATVFLLASLFVSSSLLVSSSIHGTPRFCGSKCSARCSKAGLKDQCIKYGRICCDKCKCVPSGTYGNKHECPCYHDLKNSKASLSEMEQKAREKCEDLVHNLQQCAPEGREYYEVWKYGKFWKCSEQKDLLEICLGQYGRDKAVYKELKREYKLHPKGGDGTAEL